MIQLTLWWSRSKEASSFWAPPAWCTFLPNCFSIHFHCCVGETNFLSFFPALKPFSQEKNIAKSCFPLYFFFPGKMKFLAIRFYSFWKCHRRWQFRFFSARLRDPIFLFLSRFHLWMNFGGKTAPRNLVITFFNYIFFALILKHSFPLLFQVSISKKPILSPNDSLKHKTLNKRGGFVWFWFQSLSEELSLFFHSFGSSNSPL